MDYLKVEKIASEGKIQILQSNDASRYEITWSDEIAEYVCTVVPRGDCDRETLFAGVLVNALEKWNLPESIDEKEKVFSKLLERIVSKGTEKTVSSGWLEVLIKKIPKSLSERLAPVIYAAELCDSISIGNVIYVGEVYCLESPSTMAILQVNYEA